MYKYNIDQSKIDGFSYPQNPEFGSCHVPIILSCDISKVSGASEQVLVETVKEFKISPFTSALHYAQSVFEGMKAYRQPDGSVGIYRLDAHAKRFSASAQKMGMAAVDPEFFKSCILEFVDKCASMVPTEEGYALYLRPILYGNDPVIKVKSSEKYKFAIMASVVGDYFGNGPKGSKALVSDKYVRAFPGGTGEAKTAANYALSLNALEQAYKLGFDQVLYLDAMTKTYIEELGGMNFFAVEGSTLITPKLNGQILHGVTRDSILKIGTHLGLKVEERDLSINELVEKQKCAQIKEIFACGTAAVITNLVQIGLEIGDKQMQTLDFPSNETALRLRKFLCDTHSGKTALSQQWLTIV